MRSLSMRRVAEELGTGAASLYRYVSGKDDLVDLMYDRVAGEYELAPPTGDLRADVLDIAEQARAMHRRHRWLIDTNPRNLGPHGLRCRRRSEEHTSELQSRENLVCRLLLEKKKQKSI